MGREGDQEVADESVDARKAAIWSGLAALGQLAIVVVASPPGAVAALAYLLVLPVIAVLHVRHSTVRESGAVLGTLTGMAAVVLGLVGTSDPFLGHAALVALGMWWWTIGKMWAETLLLPRPLGLLTAVLGVAAIVAGIAVPVVSGSEAMSVHAVLGIWLIGLAAAVWRQADVPSR